ncbi:MAG: threonylcarbamoyl-AMP synthase [Candidatus Sungbacteria bacterium]|nr:threonylcarbamoyl-AMP synthase [Candidatus Sungbacteria bacterium]
MKIIELNGHTFLGVLFEAVKALRAGKIIVYPTDTVYGIGGNGLDVKIVKKILKIKHRPLEKGMILLVRDIAMARKYAYIDLWAEGVLASLWPGPVTVVLHKKDIVPEEVSGGAQTIALRLPKNRFINDLTKQLDFPLISTSANISGDPSQPKTLTRFWEALQDAKVKPDLVIDAGELPANEPSTIIDLTDRKNPVVVRKGILTKADLDQMLSKHK